ncbi:magnesium-translocating P-type ATPase [Cytophagales bacterium WSM2-2]|nr:magnesium-translocating P-type ATPase [Cytophagales bacterium WSM2-2]
MTEPLRHYAVAELKKIEEEFLSSPKGLSEGQISKQEKLFGRNELRTTPNLGIFLDFLSHFKSPLVIILLFASGLSFLVGDDVNAIIIASIVLISAALDFFEERGARDAAQRLRDTVRNKALVIRDGSEREVFSEELLPGDIVKLSAGKVVPADLRIILAKDFFVNQSALTGESFPVEKTPVVPAQAQSIDEFTNIALMGSSVVTGSATAIVVKTGMSTHFGGIAAKLILPAEETSFSRGVKDFGYLVMRITLMLIVFIFLINGVLKHNWLEAFMFALAVAVGLTPELLTMIMSVSMARGSLRMAKKGAIVKKLASIPNFGSMDVLCTDKTGTLTQDKIAVVKYINANGESSDEVLRLAYLNSYYQSGMKNPLDDALLSGFKIDINNTEKTDEVPFDFFRRRMSVVVKTNGDNLLITKGAPEEILKICNTGELNDHKITDLYESLSKEGYKVIAIAVKELGHKESCLKEDEHAMLLKGFIAFLDPPKPEAAETIRSLNDIGIEVKIITGDNHLVALRICADIGLKVKGLMLGKEIDFLSDDALQIRAGNTTVFARFSPDQKNRVIHALQKRHTVGYMGDGINDAPSLKTADVGISVSNATDVAKESADIILTDKSLLILKEGVMEGRKTFVNTIKYIQMGLSSNFGNMFSMAAAAVFLPFLPMLPVQILLNNFIYDFSQVTIPTDNVDSESILYPKRWNLSFIKKFMIVFGIISSAFDLITFYIFYSYFDANESQFQTAWFLESLTTQTLVIFFIRTRKIPFMQSNASVPVIVSSIACLLLAWAIPFSPLSHYLNMTTLSANMLTVIIALVFVYLVIVELAKRIFYRFDKHIIEMERIKVVL